MTGQTATLRPGTWSRARLFAVIGAIAVTAVFIGANAHLIFVAFASKPDCVLQPAKEGVATYSAAKPSC